MRMENLEDKNSIGQLSEDLIFNIVFFLKPIEVLLINKLFYSFSKSPHYWHTLIQRDFGNQLITSAALSLHTEEEYQAIYRILFTYQIMLPIPGKRGGNEKHALLLESLIGDFCTNFEKRLNLSETAWLSFILTELSYFKEENGPGFLFNNYKSIAEAKIPVPLAKKGMALSYKNYCQEFGVAYDKEYHIELLKNASEAIPDAEVTDILDKIFWQGYRDGHRVMSEETAELLRQDIIYLAKASMKLSQEERPFSSLMISTPSADPHMILMDLYPEGSQQKLLYLEENYKYKEIFDGWSYFLMSGHIVGINKQDLHDKWFREMKAAHPLTAKNYATGLLKLYYFTSVRFI